MAQTHAERLLSGIRDRSLTVGVIGLGYVGLPLVRAVHGAGFRVVGFDIDAGKIADLRAGRAYLKHLGEVLVRELAASSRFVPTNNPKDLAPCDVIVLCVPTPLGKHHDPDLTYVERSTEMVAGVARPGSLVVLTSTSYPGTTREVCLPILERSGRKLGEDLFVSFSPEREDPGRVGVETRTIPRLHGGLDARSGEIGRAFFEACVEKVIAVESAEIAEAAKLLENIYRAVNIALVNELKPVLGAMGIDVWQVIRAASTKPFGFQAFYPGPGLGGHCIPIDPYYLTWKAREYGQTTRFIELAGEINSRMPAWVVERTVEALNEDGKAAKGSRVLLIGLAYKADIDDVRETPAAEIIKLLLEQGADVSFHDPHVPKFAGMRKYPRFNMDSVALTAGAVENSDAVLIVTDHAAVDYTLLANKAKLIVDTRDAMRRVGACRARVVKA
jgi:UDP-N-acetyl-D-glucosamine dehydrogenase